MFTHDLSPFIIDLVFLTIKWYSLAYIVGILFGWYLGKKIFIKKFEGTDGWGSIYQRPRNCVH